MVTTRSKFQLSCKSKANSNNSKPELKPKSATKKKWVHPSKSRVPNTKLRKPVYTSDSDSDSDFDLVVDSDSGSDSGSEFENETPKISRTIKRSKKNRKPYESKQPAFCFYCGKLLNRKQSTVENVSNDSFCRRTPGSTSLTCRDRWNQGLKSSENSQSSELSQLVAKQADLDQKKWIFVHTLSNRYPTKAKQIISFNTSSSCEPTININLTYFTKEPRKTTLSFKHYWSFQSPQSVTLGTIIAICLDATHHASIQEDLLGVNQIFFSDPKSPVLVLLKRKRFPLQTTFSALLKDPLLNLSTPTSIDLVFVSHPITKLAKKTILDRFKKTSFVQPESEPESESESEIDIIGNDIEPSDHSEPSESSEPLESLESLESTQTTESESNLNCFEFLNFSIEEEDRVITPLPPANDEPYSYSFSFEDDHFFPFSSDVQVREPPYSNYFGSSNMFSVVVDPKLLSI